MSMTSIMRNIEDILNQTGWGTHNKIAVFFSLLCTFCASSALTIHTFALPIAQCDIKLSQKEVLWIGAIVSLGEAFGFLMFGLLSDLCQRKTMLTFNLTVFFISCFSSGFCYEFVMYFILSFVMGVSARAIYMLSKVHLSEILPIKYRGYYIVMIDVFWIFGCIISSCTYWIMKCKPNTEYNSGTSWRLLYGFSSMMSVLCICFHGVIQPSPRYLIANRRRGEAYILFKYIFSLNNSDHMDNFKLPLSALDNLIQDIPLDRPYMSTCRESILLMKYKIVKIFQRMYIPKTLYAIIFIMVIKCNFYNGFFHTNILLANSLHLGIKNCSITPPFIFFFKDEILFTNCTYDINAVIFRDFIIIGMGGFAGLLLFCYIVDKIGRHITCVFLIICGITLTIFLYHKNLTTRYLLAILYIISFAIANSVSDLIIIENLPTITRMTGLGVVNFIPHFLKFCYLILLNMNCLMYYYITGAFLSVIGVSSYFLPDRRRKPMVE